jgi:hypothetical protein
MVIYTGKDTGEAGRPGLQANFFSSFFKFIFSIFIKYYTNYSILTPLDFMFWFRPWCVCVYIYIYHVH